MSKSWCSQTYISYIYIWLLSKLQTIRITIPAEYFTDYSDFPQFYRFLSSYSVHIQSKWKRTYTPTLYAINGTATENRKNENVFIPFVHYSLHLQCYQFELVLLPVLMGHKKQKSFDLISCFYWMYINFLLYNTSIYLFMRFYFWLSALCVRCFQTSMARKSNRKLEWVWKLCLTFAKCHKTVAFNSFSISAAGI